LFKIDTKLVRQLDISLAADNAINRKKNEEDMKRDETWRRTVSFAYSFLVKNNWRHLRVAKFRGSISAE
jgi:hypothetical protein